MADGGPDLYYLPSTFPDPPPRPMNPTLAHSFVTAPDAQPTRWIYLLHGIYGRGRNWASIARRLVERRPGWGAVLVDLREHGDSLGFSGPHTLRESAADLHQLAQELGHSPAAVLGHSFGGKVALEYAREHPQGLRQLWVMDSTPDAREPSGSAWEMIERIRAMPERFASRAEFAELLREHGYPEGVGQWMAMNLEPVDDEFSWRIDLSAMEELLRDFFRTDLWEVLEAPGGPEIHLVRATESSVLDAEAVARAEAAGRGNARVHVHALEGGHWINTDNPEGVLRLLGEELP